MADFGFNTNIPLGATVPRTSLSDMVNMASGITNLQQAQQLQPVQLEAARLQLQQAQQMNPLLLRSQTAETNVAENTARPRITQQEQAAETARIATQKAQLGLDDAQAQIAYSQGGALLGDKRVHNAADNPADAFEAIADARDRMILNGVPRAKAEAIVAPFMAQVTRSPQTLVQSLTNAINAASGAGAIAGQVNRAPTQVGTGSRIELLPTSPLQLGQQRQSVGMELPPGSRMVPTGGRDINNNPEVNVFSAEGRFLGQTTVPANVPESALPGAAPAAAPTAPRPVVPQAAASAAPSMGVARMPAGETAETMALAKSIQLKANEAAARVPQSQFNANQIIQLADKAATGKGAELLQGLTGGYAGLGLVGSTDMADALNKLGHYMALETANLAAASGLGTDAARGIAEKMTGTTSWTADAIKSTARINRAMSTGVDLFNQGVNNAVAQANNSPFAARQFQNKWSQVADVNAFRLMDAIKNNDTVAGQELIKELGGVNSPKLKQLKLKVSTINNMIGGQ
jgi:hypothetical protein